MNTITNYVKFKNGVTARFEYTEMDSFDQIDPEKVKQVYGVCWLNEKMIVVRTKTSWILPGGTRESGESIEQTLIREIREETNMRVLEWKPIGIQTVFENGKKPYLQVRAACRVSPIGPFVSDPDGDVSEIKLIDPADYKDYFDWGEIGEAIIDKARRLF